MALNKRQYVDGQTIVTASNLNEIQDCIITIEGSYVPKTRKVAGKALSSDIALSAGDVGAVPTSRTINAKALTGNITLSAADVGAVPVARTVNSKALSSNITLNAADVGAVPTTRKVNNKALSADISLTASDVGAVPTTRTVNGKALSANITLASGDIEDDSDAGGATVKASLSLLKGSLNSFRPNQLKRKWIFIGDSYGHASGSNNGWIDKLVALMGLSSSDYFESAVGGYSFTWEGSQFITLLQNLATTITDKNAITDIVVLGGANDVGQTAEAISNAIADFNTYAYTTFPNAIVRIGMIGGNGDYTKVVSQYSRVKEAYANCGKAQYLNNLEYVFQNRNLIGSDNIHPTADGYNILTNKIFEALNCGCSVIYREFGAPVAPSGYSNITNANFYNVFVNNGITQIAVGNRPGKATTDSTKYFAVQANTPIEISKLPTKLFLPPAIGPENGFVCPCFARVRSTTNNTSYQIKGYATLAAANRTLYFVPNDIILGTTSAFNSCDQIEIDAASFTCASICC